VSEANGTPFFSRRIGLADGAQADIIAGAKLSGRHGPFGIGALVTRTSEAGSVSEQTLTAARVTRRVLENSRVGFVFTNGDPLGVVENTVAGADFQFRAPNWNGGVLTSDASYVSSWQDGEAYGSAASETAFRSEAWNFTARLRAIEQGFDPRLGFTNRTDMRRINLNGWRAYRPSDSFIRYAETGLWQNYISDTDGAMRDRDYGFWFGGNSNAYDNFYFNYENLGATVTEPFNIDGATVQPGFYQEEVYDIEAYMAEQRPFALRAHVRWGGFFGGSMRLFEPGVIIRPNKHFELDFEYGHHDITLPDGNVEIHVGALDVKFNFTPNMQLFTQVQYDTMSENFSLASRLRWEPRPDTEVLFVVGHSAVVEESNFPRDYASSGTSATLRIGRTFRM
jgi:hypothetical protein